MHRFRWSKLADMHLGYGNAGGIGREARRIYEETHLRSKIHVPHHNTFAAIVRQL